VGWTGWVEDYRSKLIYSQFSHSWCGESTHKSSCALSTALSLLYLNRSWVQSLLMMKIFRPLGENLMGLSSAELRYVGLWANGMEKSSIFPSITQNPWSRKFIDWGISLNITGKSCCSNGTNPLRSEIPCYKWLLILSMTMGMKSFLRIQGRDGCWCLVDEIANAVIVICQRRYWFREFAVWARIETLGR